MKHIDWLGDTLEQLSSYPADIKRDFGYVLRFVQAGERPPSVKTFSGAIQEIREWGTDKDYRVYFVANLETSIVRNTRNGQTDNFWDSHLAKGPGPGFQPLYRRTKEE